MQSGFLKKCETKESTSVIKNSNEEWLNWQFNF
jgi:hypothetical protein